MNMAGMKVLAEKLGASFSEDISEERMKRKLHRYASEVSEDVEKELTEEEKEFLVKLDEESSTESSEVEQPKEEKAEKKPKAEKKESKKEEAPKKEKAKKEKLAKEVKPKAEKKPKEPKVRRITFICKALNSIPKMGLSSKMLAERIEDAFVKAGGESNPKQTAHHLIVVLPAAIEFGIVYSKDGLYFSK